MRTTTSIRRVAAVLAALHLLTFAEVPLAQAAMIGTAEVMQQQQHNLDRQQLLKMLDDQGVQKKLEAMGVPRDQVASRINSLTNAELAQFNQQLDPGAGGRHHRHHRVVPGDLHHHRHALRHGYLQLHQMHQSVRRLAGALLVSAMLGGCAQPPRLPPESAALPARVELREVPFFPRKPTSAVPPRWPRCLASAAWR